MAEKFPVFRCSLPSVQAPTVIEGSYVGDTMGLFALSDNLMAFATPDTMPETERLLRMVDEARVINDAKVTLWRRHWSFR